MSKYKKKEYKMSHLVIVVARKFKAGYVAHIFILDKTDQRVLNHLVDLELGPDKYL